MKKQACEGDVNVTVAKEGPCGRLLYIDFIRSPEKDMYAQRNLTKRLAGIVSTGLNRSISITGMLSICQFKRSNQIHSQFVQN